MPLCSLPAIGVVCGFVQNLFTAIGALCQNANSNTVASTSAGQAKQTFSTSTMPVPFPVHYPVIRPLLQYHEQYPTGRVGSVPMQPAYVNDVLAAFAIFTGLIVFFILAELIISLRDGLLGRVRYYLTIYSIVKDEREVKVTRLANRRLRQELLDLRTTADAAAAKLQAANSARDAATRKTVEYRDRVYACESRIVVLENTVAVKEEEVSKHQRVANDLVGRETARVADKDSLLQERRRQLSERALLDKTRADQAAERERLASLGASLRAETLAHEAALGRAQTDLAACKAELVATKKALADSETARLAGDARFKRHLRVHRKQAREEAARLGARRDAGGRLKTEKRAEEYSRPAQVDAATQTEAAVSSESRLEMRRVLLLRERDAPQELPGSAAVSAGVEPTPGTDKWSIAAPSPFLEDSESEASVDSSAAEDSESDEEDWVEAHLSGDQLRDGQAKMQSAALSAVRGTFRVEKKLYSWIEAQDTDADKDLAEAHARRCQRLLHPLSGLKPGEKKRRLEQACVASALLLDPVWRQVYDVAKGYKTPADEELGPFQAEMERVDFAMRSRGGARPKKMPVLLNEVAMSDV